jgi:hypothetical protein
VGTVSPFILVTRTFTASWPHPVPVNKSRENPLTDNLSRLQVGPLVFHAIRSLLFIGGKMVVVSNEAAAAGAFRRIAERQIQLKNAKSEATRAWFQIPQYYFAPGDTNVFTGPESDGTFARKDNQ